MKNKYFFLLLFAFILNPLLSNAGGDENVLVKINGVEITKGEFLYSYERNRQQFRNISLDEYLELFIDYKLKIADAKEAGLHESDEISKEVEAYRDKLAKGYLTDSTALEKMAREAYERMQYNVNASHILVALDRYPSPEETEEAYEKARGIKERIERGEPFNQVARATSDDHSVKQNGGDLGYFTALQMSYPFENAVYNGEPGQITEPVRTKFGYHIIRINSIEESFGEVKTAHILIRPEHANDKEAEKKIMDLHQRVKDGESFEEMARNYSADKGSAPDGGELPWFGAGEMVNEFEKAAFELESVGDISEPVKTRYGWHIIKLLDQRPLPDYQEIREELKENILTYGGERADIIKSAFTDSLKDEYNFRENPRALEAFRSMTKENLSAIDLQMLSKMSSPSTLFTFANRQVDQSDFARYLYEIQTKLETKLYPDHIDRMYRNFVEVTLTEYEDRQLEQKYPRLRYRVREYRDGLLLYEISSKRVWSDISPESRDFIEFYEKNKNDYLREERIDATIFTASSERAARRAAALAEDIHEGTRDTEWLLRRVNLFSSEPRVTARRSIFSKGESAVVDMIEWESGVAGKLLRGEENYYVVLVHKVVEPEPKPLEMVEERALKDYREYLEKKWLKELHQRYEVTVNKELIQ